MSDYTLILFKPDAQERDLWPRLFEHVQTQLGEEGKVKLVRSYVMSPKLAGAFYGRQHGGADYFDVLCDHMSTGMTLALVVYGREIMGRWRKLMGSANPTTRDRLTIRGELCREGDPLYRNLVHGSDSVESFDHEVKCLGLHPGLWL